MIVDPFEIIHVQHEHGSLRAVGGVLPQTLGDNVLKVGAVVQARKGIAVGLIP